MDETTHLERRTFEIDVRGNDDEEPGFESHRLGSLQSLAYFARVRANKEGAEDVRDLAFALEDAVEAVGSYESDEITLVRRTPDMQTMEENILLTLKVFGQRTRQQLYQKYSDIHTDKCLESLLQKGCVAITDDTVELTEHGDAVISEQMTTE